MQCNDIQEMLSAYIDGVLDENEVSAVEDHIRICSFCSQELTALRETVKLLNSLGEVSPPGEFRSRLMQRLEAVPAESGPETGRVGGLDSAGIRRWFKGINKYLVAAVLMIGLGIGTGLYKLGVSTGSQTFDLAFNSKAPTAINTQLTGGSRSKQEIPGPEAPKTAENLSLAKDSANTRNGETSLAKPKSQVSNGSGSLSQQEQNARNAAPPGLGELGSANKGIMAAGSTPKPAQQEAQETAQGPDQGTIQEPAQVQITMADSPATADNSVRTPAEDSAKEQVQYSALQPVDGTGDSVNNPADGQAGTTSEGTAERPPAMLAQSSLTEKKVAAVKPEVSTLSSPETKPDSRVGESGRKDKIPETTVKSFEPRVIQNGSLVIEVGNFQVVTAKIPEMMRQAGGFISNSSEKLVQPVTGYFTLKVPAQNLEGFLLELEHLGKVTQRQTLGTVVANDLKNVDESAAYSTIELEIKAASPASEDKSLSQGASTQSNETEPARVSSTMAGWILPGALLAAGICCAAYYFYLRWRKN